MIFYESPSNDPYYNLAMEEFFFEEMDDRESYFLLWQNANTVVVGKYQNTSEEVNGEYVRENGVKVVRRLSGGGAVYHDMGNLNFTFITDQKDIGDFNFKAFVLPVIETLKKLGVEAEFNGRNDLTIGGAKFSGNSQYAKKGRIMHHGCIMLDTDLTKVSQVLQVKEAKFQSKAVKSVRSRVTTINANAPRRIEMEEFKSLLKEEVFRSTQAETAVLDDEALSEIMRLRDEKYGTWEWNYGKSPGYDVRMEGKLAGGLVTILAQVKDGKISDIHFYGDFFGNGDLRELEDALIGSKMDGSLLKVLKGIDIDKYLNNIAPEEIYELMIKSM